MLNKISLVDCLSRIKDSPAASPDSHPGLGAIRTFTSTVL